MSNMRINDFRLTFVSTHSFLGRLENNIDRKQAWAKLTDWYEYRVVYNDLRGGSGMAPKYDLHYPWPIGQKGRRRPAARHNFWTYYLGGKNPAEVSADVAWKHIVPFRLTWRPAMLTTDDITDRVLYECYGFPHALVVTVTVQSRNIQRSIDQFVTRVRHLGMDRVFTIVFSEDGTSEGQLSVETVAELLLRTFRERYYGQLSDVVTTRPMSILTVVQGDGVDLGEQVDTPLSRKLNAVTDWPQQWEQVALPPLVQGTILPMQNQNTVPANCIYATDRGRTVWLPSLFMPGSELNADGVPRPIHKLSCLHHNLAAATVQVESLCAFARLYTDTDGYRSVGIDNIATTVAGLLTVLYDGPKHSTYRSSSVKALIAQAGLRSAIHHLCDQTGTPRIAFET